MSTMCDIQARKMLKVNQITFLISFLNANPIIAEQTPANICKHHLSQLVQFDVVKYI